MKKGIKVKIGILSIIISAIIGFIFYYITLPAINIHSAGFWSFIIVLFIILTTISGISTVLKHKKSSVVELSPTWTNFFTGSNLTYLCTAVTILLIVIFVIGYILSSPIVNAKKYQKLINIEDANFQEDIQQISYNEIPLLDRDSASLLGSRKMGSMVEYVSQFEVGRHYTQINYKNRPVRVTPLCYGSLFKWFSNRSKGIPAYITIDMANQTVDCIKLEKGMKYTDSEHFGRYIYRYLRFHYPTYIFDDIKFEIDDNGTPYWICPVKDFTIGLFGGEKIKNVVLVNAVTGEHTNYKINNVPNWIDNVYNADLLDSYYNYYGKLKHGYFNTLFSQKDCLQTTEGYNYIALNDDVWMYTGVTSVGGDESLVGFILCNQRTAETKYYAIAGAKEYSAMESAEGKVQNLGYNATFPLLLNISNEPTYVMTLKDSAGLVKKYAMVNIAQYTVVAIGDSITECEKNYISQLKSNNIHVTDTSTLPSVTDTIKSITQCVVEGNTHFYIILNGSDTIYDVSVPEHVSIIRYKEGDVITLSYMEGSELNVVSKVGTENE